MSAGVVMTFLPIDRGGAFDGVGLSGERRNDARASPAQR